MLNLLDVAVSPFDFLIIFFAEFSLPLFIIGIIALLTVIIVFIALSSKKNKKQNNDDEEQPK